MNKTDQETVNFASIEQIIHDIRSGKMVIIVDDENRENEGDLMIAADKVKPEDINFMTHNGRGLICLTLTKSRCNKLHLPLMATENYDLESTNFTISIDASVGITTGSSVQDRTRTVKAAIAPNAKPEDIKQPGHLLPLMADPGGVLIRPGHTEEGCDLTRLAGLTSAAVIYLGANVIKTKGMATQNKHIAGIIKKSLPLIVKSSTKNRAIKQRKILL